MTDHIRTDLEMYVSTLKGSLKEAEDNYEAAAFNDDRYAQSVISTVVNVYTKIITNLEAILNAQQYDDEKW